MLVLVNARLAHQRKLVEGADRGTTHHAKTDQPPFRYLRQLSKPNPTRPLANSGNDVGKGRRLRSRRLQEPQTERREHHSKCSQSGAWRGSRIGHSPSKRRQLARLGHEPATPPQASTKRCAQVVWRTKPEHNSSVVLKVKQCSKRKDQGSSWNCQRSRRAS